MINSAGIFIFNKTNNLLIGHASGNPIDKSWSIPKGKQDENEELIDTAIRETYEEVNINLSEFKDKIVYIGSEVYPNNKKMLHGYMYKFNTDVNYKLQCTSLITKGYLFGYPEFDNIQWITIENAVPLIHIAQQQLLIKLMETL